MDIAFNEDKENMSRVIYGMFLLFLMASVSAFSQSESMLELHIGPELDERKGDQLLFTFGRSNEFFYNLWSDRRKNGAFILERISTDSLNVLEETNFNFPEIKGLTPTLAYPFSIKEKNFLMATAEDPNNNNLYIFAFPILERARIANEPITLGVGNREAIVAENGFLFFQSENSDLAALFIPKEKAYEKNEKFILVYFDSDLKQLSKREFEIPYSSGEVRLEDAIITDRGFFHGIISMSKDTRVRITPDSYALLTYDPDQDAIREKNLALGSKWFYDLKMTLTPDSNLWLAGYYSNMVELSMAGSFSVVVDSKTGELLNTGLYPFEREFRLQFRSDIKRGEDELGLFKLDVAKLIRPERLSLVSEKRYRRESTIFNPATGTYSIVQIHNYDEILISVLRPSSRIDFNALIPKYQSYSGDPGRFTSYAAVETEEEIFLFYNDHVKNLNLSVRDFTEYRQLNNENNMTLTYCRFDGENLERKSYKPEALDGYYLDPRHFYQTDDAAILTTYKGYRIKYIRIDLPRYE